jgi:hypothetical protein
LLLIWDILFARHHPLPGWQALLDGGGGNDIKDGTKSSKLHC